jgi:hypothetical protein
MPEKSPSRAGPKTRRSGASPHSPSAVVLVRRIREATRLLLCVRAGGRCEFDGHNAYLFEHPITLHEGTFGEMAHIVAFKKAGPRGEENRPDDINNVDNLMLLCPTCHKLVDDHCAEYPRERLEGYKREHESRIAHLTSLGSDRKTSVIVFKAPIAGQTVAVPFDHIVEATFPRYPKTRAPLTIDLTGLAEGPAFTEAACSTIAKRIDPLFEPEGEAAQVGHVSIFALGPIPLLICLGRHLTSKVPIDVFQRHRDNELWAWKADGPEVSFRHAMIKKGDPQRVAVVVSLSGSISAADLPPDVRDTATVYEMTLEGIAPSPTFLRRRQDLEAFRVAYQELLGMIGQQHGRLDEIDFFPAVPAPVAVLCGRELLPKVHPKLRVFDFNKQTGGFSYQLTV